MKWDYVLGDGFWKIIMSTDTLESSYLRKRARRQGAVLLEQVEQFALLKRPNIQQLNSLKEMFYSLAKKTDAEQRRKMSILLSRSPYTPRSVLLFLSMDAVEISSPILLFSPVLTNRDLCNIINKMGIDFARIIARRDDIDTCIIAALLEKDDENQTILKVIKQNVSAKPILKKYLVGKNRDVISRPATKPLITESAVSNHLNKKGEPVNIKHKDASDQLVAIAGRGGKLGKSQNTSSAKPIENVVRDVERAIIAAARIPDRNQLSKTLRNVCGINPKTVRSYLDGGDVGTFACLLSAIGLGPASAGRILLLQFSILGRDKLVFENVLRQYAQLDRGKTLSFFQRTVPGFRVPTIDDKDRAISAPVGLLLQNRRNLFNGSEPDQDQKTSKIKLAEPA